MKLPPSASLERIQIFRLENPNGRPIFLNVPRMIEWATRHCELRMCWIDNNEADRFVKQGRVNLKYAIEKAERNLGIPIIYCHDAPTKNSIALADGAHRYVAAAVQGMTLMPAFFLTRKEWKQFKI